MDRWRGHARRPAGQDDVDSFCCVRVPGLASASSRFLSHRLPVAEPYIMPPDAADQQYKMRPNAVQGLDHPQKTPAPVLAKATDHREFNPRGPNTFVVPLTATTRLNPPADGGRPFGRVGAPGLQCRWHSELPQVRMQHRRWVGYALCGRDGINVCIGMRRVCCTYASTRDHNFVEVWYLGWAPPSRWRTTVELTCLLTTQPSRAALLTRWYRDSRCARRGAGGGIWVARAHAGGGHAS